VEKENLRRCWRTFKAFKIFVARGWNGKLFWRNVCFTTREERVVRKCICIGMYFNGKMVEEFNVF
jgi:hypothetical protein